MSKNELKELLKDSLPKKQPCSVAEFEKRMEKASKSGIIQLDEKEEV